ncbi:unnamed protein product [Phytophthora fragariaefolia]|uniref:Unnamed protein product n=1 Tax=Phytophthora fragariaefolia TaxID=1490495 RepID=A0A9W6X351_9STRA|nr:unnamed protein product [Phytophthora fragariaefolia]
MSEEPEFGIPEHKLESDASSERLEDADMTDMAVEERAEREIATPVAVETGTNRQQKKAAANTLRGRPPTVRIRPQYKGNVTLQAEAETNSQEVGTTMTSEQGQQVAEQTTDQRSKRGQCHQSGGRRRHPGKEKTTRQQFIHQYMQATSGNVNEGEEENPRERKTEAGAAEQPDATQPEAAQEEECCITRVNPSTDACAPLSAWLSTLGGKVVNVAANGHCGWLAFYAALFNVEEGLDSVSKEVADSANLLKKQVLNAMIANIMDEVKLHPQDLQAELRASGCHTAAAGTHEEQVCAIVNHYVAQRDKSVRAHVPMPFWIRPAHIKAMTQYARETIYVLDVQSDGQARMQAYAFHEVEAPPDMKIETGTVCPVPTEHALGLLGDLVAARITPPVMVLRWNDTGNHFQAVNYQAKEHEHYATNIAALSQKRNEILIEHGWKALDVIEYDEDKTGRAAAQTIKTVRRAAKEAMKATELHTGAESGAKDGSPDSALELESVPSNGHERSSAGAQRELFMNKWSQEEDLSTQAKEGRQDVLREVEEVRSTELSQSRTEEEQRDATQGIWKEKPAECRQGQSNQELEPLNQHHISGKTNDGQHAQTTMTTSEATVGERREQGKKRGGTGSIRDYFSGQTREERREAAKTDFRRLGRQLKRNKKRALGYNSHMQAQKHKQDRTIGVTTITVRGLATHIRNLGSKLQGLKDQHRRGVRDVIFLQETHLHPSEHDNAAQQHGAMWGFNYTTANKFSFWASGNDRRAGVAILVNPYGAVRNVKAWNADKWSEYLVMVTGELAGKRILFVNVYAPVHGVTRVLFFRRLHQLTFPEDVSIIYGGDFNCVANNGLDREGGSRKLELGAKELEGFAATHGLWDTGFYNFPRTDGITAKREYAQRCHTHFHTVASGKKGSSRLDRFYVSTTVKGLVRGSEVEAALCKSDHRAVLLELHSPKGIIRVKKRPKLYPAPAYVQTAMNSLIAQSIETLGDKLKQDTEGKAAKSWYDFKVNLKADMNKLKTAAKKRTTVGFRQRIQRIKAQLAKPGTGQLYQNGARKELSAALHRTQEARRALNRRILVASNAWSSKASTKRFFKRVCTKFADNTIPTLISRKEDSTRDTHDRPISAAESWENIFRWEAEDKSNIDDFIGIYSKKWKQVDLPELDEEITEVEVAAAIAKGKRGKACGPDQLGNEWYRDHAAALTPVLTRIYNECLEQLSGGIHFQHWKGRGYCGFIPGRTIHEAIDILEAAKEICRSNGELTEAQVLLLDFAKAYDSLDREFLMAILKAKGFPPKLCRIIRATHTNTTVQFLANGHLSDKVQVTSGIRQVTTSWKEYSLGGDYTTAPIRVAGYADDTAIYIAHKNMQEAAIVAVTKFSRVSGLKRNVQKSAAIRLGLEEPQDDDATVTTTGGTRTGAGELTAGVPQPVEVTPTTRYLGHLAGAGSTVKLTWKRAFAALRVRLVLAEAKTNSVQQRSAIAAAVIIPKMLYVARHAWPTEEIITQADLSIRNYVWKAKFMAPEHSPADEQKQRVGEILQQRDCGETDFLVPRKITPKAEPQGTLWGTGRPWVEAHFHEMHHPAKDDTAVLQDIRRALRYDNGLLTRWTTHGLKIHCTGQARLNLARRRNERHKTSGECYTETIGEVMLTALWLGNTQGGEGKWGDYKKVLTTIRGRKVKDVVQITKLEDEGVLFTPQAHQIPMESGVAHLFRELSLNLLVNYPEILFSKTQNKQIEHSWGPTPARIDWDRQQHSVDTAIARFLGVGERSVWSVPHPWLTRCRPLWAGKRRWAQSRRKYKQQMNKNKNKEAEDLCKRADRKLAAANEKLAGALRKVSWKRIQRMEGVSAYHTQNIVKLKHNRLRIWAGAEHKFKCTATRFTNATTTGTTHLVWQCPEAAQLWTMMLQGWGLAQSGQRCTEQEREAALPDIFSFTLRMLPSWLVEWGRTGNLEPWSDVIEVASDLWQQGVAVLITHIWRRNVDRVHHDGRKERKMVEVTSGARGSIVEAFERYKLGLYPLNNLSELRLRIAEFILTKWRTFVHNEPEHQVVAVGARVKRVGFFYGGSRGNPGPGGSGSVFIVLREDDDTATPEWAAVTALGRRTTTNNEAEIIGMHRLLLRAVNMA